MTHPRQDGSELERLHLPIDIRRQPDETTCGPTCLDAVYRYYGDGLPLETIISETRRFEEGGTLAVYLACHALGRGYRATLYTYNVHVFDPSWFGGEPTDIRERLRRQAAFKDSTKLRATTDAYLDFLERGGVVKLEDLTPALLRRYLEHSTPILTGLSATYLYRTPRETSHAYDDLRGVASGHFVVLCGYDTEKDEVRVADPSLPNPFSGHYYSVAIHRLIGAVYLGVVTEDANLLVLEPGHSRPT
jgi:hypothetical protein